MAYPYVPQSGPDFVPLNANQLPRGYWVGFGMVLVVLTMLAILLTTY
jgi:hypothetical protein